MYTVLATNVASTRVDYYPRVVFPLKCGSSGPMVPSDSRGFPSQVIPFSRGFEAAQVALPLLSSSPLPLRDCPGSPILRLSLAVIFGRVAHVSVHIGRRHFYFKAVSKEVQRVKKMTLRIPVGIRHVMVVLCHHGHCTGNECLLSIIASFGG